MSLSSVFTLTNVMLTPMSKTFFFQTLGTKQTHNWVKWQTLTQRVTLGPNAQITSLSKMTSK